MAWGLSNSIRLPSPRLFIWMTENVEYASPRTLHTGRVWIIVSMQSIRSMSLEIIRQRIFEVRVERMLAFTPLPSPSARTRVVQSPFRQSSTWSPHNSSPYLLSDEQPYSRQRSIRYSSFLSSSRIFFRFTSATLVSAVVSPRRDAISWATRICLVITSSAVRMVFWRTSSSCWL